jgi:hypothetical protein
MKKSTKRPAGRRVQGTGCWWLQVFLILSFGVCGVRPGGALTANAVVSGHITDSTGAVIPGAMVTLTESDTRVAAKAMSNNEGLYIFPSVKPGNYAMTVSASGFNNTTITSLAAGVQASLALDVVLRIGAATQTVTVTDQATDVAGTSSELGTQIGEHQIHDLPLNGRNFTELLTLTPGASPISTSQSNKVAVNDQGVLGVPSAQFSQPAIQGQINRENLYLLDGVVNTDFTNGVYVIPPIIDDMQEFKVQSHDDVAGLMELKGGAEEFSRQLEDFFEKTPSSFGWNDYYNHANEPVHHVPYLFVYAGKPWLTQRWVRRILTNAYHNDVNGICGNDDVGQMSAWYVLGAMGFYSVCPGDGIYILGSPLFSRITLHLDEEWYKRAQFTITAENQAPDHPYIQLAKLNGKPLSRAWIRHSEIAAGGVLEFVMGPEPRTGQPAASISRRR